MYGCSRYVFLRSFHPDGSVSQWHLLGRPFDRLSGEFLSVGVTHHGSLHRSLPSGRTQWDPTLSYMQPPGKATSTAKTYGIRGIRNGVETPIVSDDAASGKHLGLLRLLCRVFPPTQLLRHVTCRWKGTLRLRCAIIQPSSSCRFR